MGHSNTHARFHRNFNDRNFAAIEAQLAPGFVYEDLAQLLTVKTPGGFVEYLQGWVAALSDATPGSPTYSEGTDFSVARFQGRGTFDGNFGGIAGNGRTMDVPCCEVMHYGTDGKALSGELYYDQMSIIRQLGPRPAEE
jgi:hypothetical protein